LITAIRWREGPSAVLRRSSIAPRGGGGGNWTRVPKSFQCQSSIHLRRLPPRPVGSASGRFSPPRVGRKLALTDAESQGDDHGSGARQQLTTRLGRHPVSCSLH
jgi:hypothetical protein